MLLRCTHMLNWFAKSCITVTTVAPACGAASIASYFEFKHTSWCIFRVIAGVLSLAVSWLIVAFAKQNVEAAALQVVEVEQAGQRVLEFLLAYLFPLSPQSACRMQLGQSH